MSQQPMHVPDGMDRATELFWNPPSLEGQMAHVQPWSGNQQFVIDDLAPEEWDAFTTALHA